MRRITKAFLFAPILFVLAAIAIIILATIVLSIIGLASGGSAGLAKGLAPLGLLTSLIGVVVIVVAYMGVLVFGVPAYVILKYFNKLSLAWIMPLAFISGEAMVVLCGFHAVNTADEAYYSHGFWLSVLKDGLFFSVCAMTVAYIIWFTGIREPKKKPAPDQP